MRLPAALLRTLALPRAPGVQPLPLAKPRCCATCAAWPTRDLSLDRSMIPLGSCTMKLNAASEMLPITWPEFAGLHPFAPRRPGRGLPATDHASWKPWLCANHRLRRRLAAAQRRLPGRIRRLLVIRAYHHSRGEDASQHLPDSRLRPRHQPGQRSMAGMQVVVVACDEHGNVDLDRPARQGRRSTRARLAALMITYPSTHGVFEEGIRRNLRHRPRHGGQVYMDGANLNAQVGLCAPGHSAPTSATSTCTRPSASRTAAAARAWGRLAVKAHLAPFLPGHRRAWPTPGRRGLRRALGQRQHPADFLDVHRSMMGGEGLQARHASGDPERQLHRPAPGGALPGALQRQPWPGRPRMHPRPAPAQGKQRHQRRRRRQAPDGLRLPRTDHVVAGGRHADGRAHRKRIQGGTGPLLRRHDRHPRGNPRGRARASGCARTIR